jgi:hypothetical protein
VNYQEFKGLKAKQLGFNDSLGYIMGIAPCFVMENAANLWRIFKAFTL